MDLINFSAVDAYVYQIILINLVIAVGLLSGLRFVTGLVANVDSAEELATRDNYAFGLAMAAGIVALALMLTGAVSGEVGDTYLSEIVSVLSYGILGVVLIKVGRLIQDKFVLTGIQIQQQIKSGNLAAALVDAANTLATGLILRAVMLWVESDANTQIEVNLGCFPSFAHPFPDTTCGNQCPLLGTVRQNNNDLVSSPPENEICPSRACLDTLGYCL